MDEAATLMTDMNPGYVTIGRAYADHQSVDHAQGEYVRGKAHVNTAEGYFSQLKRSLDGTYHHVSPEHLPRYLAEFDYRYNTRKEKDGQRMVRGIRGGRGKRLMYQETKAQPE